MTPMRFRINPRKRKARKARRSRARRNPSQKRNRFGKRVFPVIYLNRKGVYTRAKKSRKRGRWLINPKRRRRSYRRNPAMNLAGLKRVMSKPMLMNLAGTLAGFLGGHIVVGTLRKQSFVPQNEMVQKSLGLLAVVLGGAVAMKSGKPLLRSAGGGIALAGTYDLVQKWVPTLNLPEINLSVPGLGSDIYLGSPVYPAHGYSPVDRYEGVEVGTDISLGDEDSIFGEE